MAERECSSCGEVFWASGRRKICPECVGERGPRDTVSEMASSEAHRLNQGLKAINRAGR